MEFTGICLSHMSIIRSGMMGVLPGWDQAHKTIALKDLSSFQVETGSAR